MANYSYHRPANTEAAANAFKESDTPSYLAGGMSLLPVIKQRLASPSDLIDLELVEGLTGIDVKDDHVVIRAMTRHADVAASTALKKVHPVLPELAGGIGDPQVRNRGTIGGSIANSDPAADYPCAVLGLNATVVTNLREVPADEFFLDLFETALEQGELITAVRFPKVEAAAYEKFRHPVSRFALVGVLVSRNKGSVRVAVTGAGPCVFRLPEIEKLLTEEFSASRIPSEILCPVTLNTDIHADSEYRAHLVQVLTKRCVARLEASK